MPDPRFGTVRTNYGPSIEPPEMSTVPPPMAIDQGFRRRTSLSMMYASPEAKAPLVMTLSGYPDTPDILEMVSDDGTKREFAIVDRARFERINRFIRAFEQAPDPHWHNAGGLLDFSESIGEVHAALDALEPGDIDPLPEVTFSGPGQFRGNH